METHNLRFIPIPEQPAKVDDSQWTKTRIREELKVLRQQCYEYVNEHDEWARTFNSKRHEQLLRKIADYKFRLSGRTKSSSITPEDVSRAKQHPISEYYVGRLRRAGKDLVGLCPFHNDKNPSFTIYNTDSRFKCFSCGANGDVLDFIQKTHNLSFPLAVKYILKI